MSSRATSGDDDSKIRILTENLPPLAYIDPQSGKLVGESANQVNVACKALGIQRAIEVLPWARALLIAETEPNVLIFNLARTKERENRFIWIHNTGVKRIGVFCLRKRDKVVIHTVEDLKQYSIAVLNQNIAQIVLQERGVTRLVSVAKFEFLVPFVFAGRADLWARTMVDEHDMDAVIKSYGYNPDDLVKVYELTNETVDLYFAASIGTDLHVVQKFMDAFQSQEEKRSYRTPLKDVAKTDKF